ncbi:hypothetical protein PWT90_11046 [Aphanocladium album]|nr:hypothetical protein PWT90_11046 [Aphanocladium album]
MCSFNGLLPSASVSQQRTPTLRRILSEQGPLRHLAELLGKEAALGRLALAQQLRDYLVKFVPYVIPRLVVLARLQLLHQPIAERRRRVRVRVRQQQQHHVQRRPRLAAQLLVAAVQIHSPQGHGRGNVALHGRVDEPRRDEQVLGHRAAQPGLELAGEVLVADGAPRRRQETLHRGLGGRDAARVHDAVQARRGRQVAVEEEGVDEGVVVVVLQARALCQHVERLAGDSRVGLARRRVEHVLDDAVRRVHPAAAHEAVPAGQRARVVERGTAHVEREDLQRVEAPRGVERQPRRQRLHHLLDEAHAAQHQDEDVVDPGVDPRRRARVQLHERVVGQLVLLVTQQRHSDRQPALRPPARPRLLQDLQHRRVVGVHREGLERAAVKRRRGVDALMVHVLHEPDERDAAAPGVRHGVGEALVEERRQALPPPHHQVVDDMDDAPVSVHERCRLPWFLAAA